tara:strand:+ start:528 stop:1490 length:963 start_codon:yes stop_codon:yes gene_type:complete
MIDYQEAPYLELDNYKAPKGIKCIFIPMDDNKKIRLAYWQNSSMQSKIRGTILLQQGHNEFIEKYFETIQELLNRNFNVVCFDWRGQGLSDKMIKNPNKQYISDFKIHDEDLQFIIDEIISKNFSEPLIAIGHSMGGCLILSSLKENGHKFSKVILSAPMLGFKNEFFLMPLISLANIFFSKYSFLLGSQPNMGQETPFEQNDLTNDRKRYLRTQRLVRQKKEIRLWGVTNGWAKSAKKALMTIRKIGWAESILTKILIINSLDDRVVSSDKIIEMSKRLKNSKIINFKSCEHEILMEKDEHRKRFWLYFDKFINDLPFD